MTQFERVHIVATARLLMINNNTLVIVLLKLVQLYNKQNWTRYLIASARSKCSDEPAHPRSLARAFAARLDKV